MRRRRRRRDLVRPGIAILFDYFIFTLLYICSYTCCRVLLYLNMYE